LLAFRLDAVQGRKLAGSTQKDRVENLLSRVPRIPAPFGQNRHPIREIKHLIEIGLELVPAQG
jgi:hypothetical protein